MEKKRSNGLIVLCILSFLYIGFNLWGVVEGFASGPLTDEEIRQEKLNILSDQTPEMIEMMGGMLEESVAILEATQAFHYQVNAINLALYLIGLVGILMLFRQQKLGFYLYIIYCLAEIGSTAYYFGEFKIGLFGILLSAVFSILFIILYWHQVKRFA